jgi:hypothetical protein
LLHLPLSFVVGIFTIVGKGARESHEKTGCFTRYLRMKSHAIFTNGDDMKFWISLIAIALAGCASTGPVPIGKDTYMISKQNAAGAFGTSGAVKADIIREGSAFCVSSGKVFQLVSSAGKEASYTSNPVAEISFMCLSEGDPEIARPKLRKEADAVIEVRK